MTAANYPLTIEEGNKEHLRLQKHYKKYFESLQHILPCKYCRESYAIFIKELPIDGYLSSRRRVMYWLYLIKNRVNAKLLKQGNKVKAAPPFKDVVAYYEQFRASCKDKTKTCKKTEKK